MIRQAANETRNPVDISALWLRGGFDVRTGYIYRRRRLTSPRKDGACFPTVVTARILLAGRLEGRPGISIKHDPVICQTGPLANWMDLDRDRVGHLLHAHCINTVVIFPVKTRLKCYGTGCTLRMLGDLHTACGNCAWFFMFLWERVNVKERSTMYFYSRLPHFFGILQNVLNHRDNHSLASRILLERVMKLWFYELEIKHVLVF